LRVSPAGPEIARASQRRAHVASTQQLDGTPPTPVSAHSAPDRRARPTLPGQMRKSAGTDGSENSRCNSETVGSCHAPPQALRQSCPRPHRPESSIQASERLPPPRPAPTPASSPRARVASRAPSAGALTPARSACSDRRRRAGAGRGGRPPLRQALHLRGDRPTGN